MNHRGNEYQHEQAAKWLGLALADLRRALAAEGNLEWTRSIEELIHETEYVRGKVEGYAKFARVEAP